MDTCIVLSAGLSNRFGSPKALAKINGQTVIERIQNMLISSEINKIIVVLGAYADEINPYLLKHTKVKFVYNKDYNFGQTSSFKVGLGAVEPNCKACLLLPIDYPLVKSQTINSLLDVFYLNDKKIIIPSYQSKKGHPPVFSGELKEEFLSLDNSEGINSINHRHSDNVLIAPVDDSGTILSFNTKNEFEELKRQII